MCGEMPFEKCVIVYCTSFVNIKAMSRSCLVVSQSLFNPRCIAVSLPRVRFFSSSRRRNDQMITLTAPNGHVFSQPCGLFIDNAFSSSSTAIPAIDPATGSSIVSISSASPNDIDQAVKAAHDAYNALSWRDIDSNVRRDLLLRLSSLIEQHSETLATIETWDTGKPITSTIEFDISDVISTLKYYAGWADKLAGSSHSLGSSKWAYTIREPLGVCALIVPWNYPLSLTMWKLAPALAAGNTVVLKPSEHTSLSALYLGQLIQEAGFPAGVVNIVSGDGAAGEALCSHPDIAKISFTGSTKTAQSVMRSASASLASLTLETGGKSPLIVFEDADIEQAARWAHGGVMANSGQICTSTAKMIVHKNVYDRFVEALKEYTLKTSVIGSPWDPNTFQGPQTTKAQYDRILSYMSIAKSEGLTPALGASGFSPLPNKGYYIAPTILTNVSPASTLACEEIFGPIATILPPFETESEAIKLANDTRYGLAASVFTQDVARAHRVARSIKTGMVWVNSSQDCDVRVPFGGVGLSGVGRELGEEGLRAYTVEKSVHVNLGMRL